jgi:hypothetical protein
MCINIFFHLIGTYVSLVATSTVTKLVSQLVHQKFITHGQHIRVTSRHTNRA